MHPQGNCRDERDAELLACDIDPAEFDALLVRLRRRHDHRSAGVPARAGAPAEPALAERREVEITDEATRAALERAVWSAAARSLPTDGGSIDGTRGWFYDQGLVPSAGSLDELDEILDSLVEHRNLIRDVQTAAIGDRVLLARQQAIDLETDLRDVIADLEDDVDDCIHRSERLSAARGLLGTLTVEAR